LPGRGPVTIGFCFYLQAGCRKNSAANVLRPLCEWGTENFSEQIAPPQMAAKLSSSNPSMGMNAHRKTVH
jgi:hypothetical protein